MSEFIAVKSSQPAGDCISILPSLRQIYRSTGKKVLFYQALNVVGEGMPGIKQPFTNEHGESIMMGNQTFKMLSPLLKSQEYIYDFIEFTGQEVMYDLDEIRLKTFCNQPNGSINRYLFYVFPEMACDLSEKWLWITDIGKTKGFDIHNNGNSADHFKDLVILNFTPRYRNNWVHYYFLKEYQNRLVFSGLPQEHEDFCKKWDLDISYLEYNDFYELACAMRICKFYMGNASLGFQIAEGLKIPRLLETFQVIPNVIPFGKNGYDYYHQGAAEFYFKKLIQ